MIGPARDALTSGQAHNQSNTRDMLVLSSDPPLRIVSVGIITVIRRIEDARPTSSSDHAGWLPQMRGLPSSPDLSWSTRLVWLRPSLCSVAFLSPAAL